MFSHSSTWTIIAVVLLAITQIAGSASRARFNSLQEEKIGVVRTELHQYIRSNDAMQAAIKEQQEAMGKQAALNQVLLDMMEQLSNGK